jgi:hypothetical protein
MTNLQLQIVFLISVSSVPPWLKQLNLNCIAFRRGVAEFVRWRVKQFHGAADEGVFGDFGRLLASRGARLRDGRPRRDAFGHRALKLRENGIDGRSGALWCGWLVGRYYFRDMRRIAAERDGLSGFPGLRWFS